MIEIAAAGALTGGTLVWVRVRWLERHAGRERERVARGYGRVSGRVMRQLGERCPNAWPSSDRELDAFNRGAREGWLEQDRELAEGARWVVRGAERITRDAA